MLFDERSEALTAYVREAPDDIHSRPIRWLVQEQDALLVLDVLDGAGGPLLKSRLFEGESFAAPAKEGVLPKCDHILVDIIEIGRLLAIGVKGLVIIVVAMDKEGRESDSFQDIKDLLLSAGKDGNIPATHEHVRLVLLLEFHEIIKQTLRHMHIGAGEDAHTVNSKRDV